MTATRLATAFTLLAVLTAACSQTTAASSPTPVDVHGVLDLNDSHGGVWGTQNSLTVGGPCSVTKDLLPAAPFPRAFPPDAQVVVKDATGTVVAATSLDTPKDGTVRAMQGRPSALYCEFTWRVTVRSAATVYTFEFPGASPQRFEARSVPHPVVLTIGDGAGFVPGGY